jgi:dTDP-4-dehydrorhamnose 3,5-epimerase
MKLKVTKADIKDLLIVEPTCFEDDRGFFMEPWNKRDFFDIGISVDFVQEGHSRSKPGVIRGLHYQRGTASQAKLVRCIFGKVFDVAVDLRVKSKTFGKWFGVELSAENKKQLYIPIGFGHGFAVLDNCAEILYKQSSYYTPTLEGSVVWNDPNIDIKWPVNNPTLSEKDKNAQTLKEYLKNPAFS